MRAGLRDERLFAYNRGHVGDARRSHRGTDLIDPRELALAGEAQALLDGALGFEGTFREGQLEAIVDVVVHRRRVLLVQRTGWGKSFVYFISTALLRRRGSGTTLLISPLLSLMRNQVAMAQRMGIRAADLHSANPDEHERIITAVQAGEVDLLLVSPERLGNREFRSAVLPAVMSSPGMIVVDEVHCLSDWGHDFRPDYRLIARVLDALPSTTPVLCTTATANDRVIADLVAQLGDNLTVQRGQLARKSLRLAVIEAGSQAERLAWLATTLPTLAGTGIVYCLTVRDTAIVAGWLRQQGIDAVAYSGEGEPADREEIERRLLDNRLKVVVATSALGMGFDKGDLAFVIHYQAPGSVIAYYQQIGRAGRALDDAPVILLRGAEDEQIQDYFINTAFPRREDAERVIALLDEHDAAVSVPRLLGEVNVRPSRLDTMLKVLAAEGGVERVVGGWRRTLTPWTYDVDRVERVTAQRRHEQQAMRLYGTTSECLMTYLQHQLDDVSGGTCGRCAVCTGWDPRLPLSAELAGAAQQYLLSQALTIQPRKRWPAGLHGVHGAIPVEERPEDGRALSVYGDGGWGRVVAEGRFRHGEFSDDLVAAAARLIVERWAPRPPPGWVTAIPSREHPALVGGFAHRLATRLGLPCVPCLEKVRDVPPQKEMENSTQQARNVLNVFAVVGSVANSPVLLVDDIIDSGWTLTIAGIALRRAGSGAVHPFVLARAVG